MLLRVAVEVNQGGVVGTEVEVGNVSSYNLWPLQVSEHCLKQDRIGRWLLGNYEERLSSYGIVYHGTPSAVVFLRQRGDRLDK